MDMRVLSAVFFLLLSAPYILGQSYISTITITQTAGYSAVLTCQVQNLGNSAKVIWLGPSGSPLTIGRQRITTDIRFSVERPYHIDWNLHIRHVKPSDAGEYICKVTSTPPQTKHVKLVVKVSPVINHDESTKDPQTVVEGDNLTLTCVVTAEPPASFMWFYINKKEKKEQLSVTGDTITIHQISREQAGIYECLAFNGISPTATKQITVNVEFAPIVSTANDKMSQYRGRDTSIDCKITAYPAEIAIWRKGDMEIEEGETIWKYVPTLYKNSESEFILNLQIYTLEPDDFGLYTCEASNPHGRSTTSVLIEEIIVTKPPTTTTTSSTTTVSSSSSSSTTTTTITSPSYANTTLSTTATTTIKGVIIDDGNSSNNGGDTDPKYAIITTPSVKPVSPGGQYPTDSAIVLGWKWFLLPITILVIMAV